MLLVVLSLIMLASNFAKTIGFAAGRMVARHPVRLLAIGGGSTDSDALKPFYALGVNIAQQVKSEVNPLLNKEEIEQLINGFSDSLTNKIPDDRAVLQQYGQKLNEILNGRMQAQVEVQKKAGQDFITRYLLSNAKAIKTTSGLIFHEIIAGIGAQPNPNSTVSVHYHGTFTDGKAFDSSHERGQPVQFPLNGVIKGWQEGVSRMRVGGKATLIVPSDLAYGDAGSPPVIPPGATLRFDVELLEVK